MKYAIALFMALLISQGWSQLPECVPAKVENLLVYDMAKILKPHEVEQLEQNLQNFARETSNQIVILTLPDLCGNIASDLSFQIIDEWGIGQADLDNGILVLIKPKNQAEKGQIFIATGRGLEGVLHAGKLHIIWENEMIPLFKKNQYFQGIWNGLRVIEQLAQKEFDIDTYAKQHKQKKDKGGWVGLLIFGAIALMFLFGKNKSMARANNLPFWTAFWLANSGPRRGYWNDFNSRNDGWGGGGGFGGFGGGSSGGGGAGGSW
ncbi:MAG: TPM domain-containing protein [Bacteroidetes bacterium]|nr:TPM domain-containing protein [Bacteroidota bacterium]